MLSLCFRNSVKLPELSWYSLKQELQDKIRNLKAEKTVLVDFHTFNETIQLSTNIWPHETWTEHISIFLRKLLHWIECDISHQNVFMNELSSMCVWNNDLSTFKRPEEMHHKYKYRRTKSISCFYKSLKKNQALMKWTTIQLNIINTYTTIQMFCECFFKEINTCIQQEILEICRSTQCIYRIYLQRQTGRQ